MSDDITTRAGDTAPESGLRGRVPIAAFTADAESQAALQQGLLGASAEGIVVQRASIRGAIAALRTSPAPRVLVVDITGEEQPLTALASLSEVVEPDVCVLAIGDRQDVNLYRQLTRGLGV
ncbi:MAG: hypothetical protein M3Y41_01930, partial [Pseudomonadota bacterium]|nr:hypothetical protein [Pseudomonadota bacterium]